MSYLSAAYLRGGGASATLNCGYARGFPVLEVIETVKRVSGVDSRSNSRAGGPAIRHHIVAAADRARSTLKWQPHFDDLQTVISHVLAERKLAECAPANDARSPIPRCFRPKLQLRAAPVVKLSSLSEIRTSRRCRNSLR
jgi:hypothetical protein